MTMVVVAAVLFVLVRLDWACAAKPVTIKVKDFGAIADSQGDAGPGIRKAIEAARAAGGPAEVVLEAGKYRITSLQDARFCFVIQAAHNLTLRGMPGRTEIVIANPKFLAFLIFDCDNVFLKDFAIDYDPVPFTQGKVVAVDAAGGTFDLDIEPGYSLMTEPWFVDAPQPAPQLGHIMDAKARKLKPNAPDHMFVAAWAPVAGRVLRMTPPASYKGPLSCLAPGDHFVITARSPSGTIEFNHNRSGGMENVTLYAGAGLTVALIGNEGALEFRHCSIRFKPGTTRLITANGDGFHCVANRKGPIVENGYFEGMPDDTMNVYCPPNTVLEKRSSTDLLVTGNNSLRLGDLLQIFDAAAGVRAEVKAAGVRPQGDGYLVTLDHPVQEIMSKKDRPLADTLYNLSACGEGFIFRNNTVGAHRRHGILVRAPNGLIEGNTFKHLSGCGIAIGNEPHWPEGPVPRNITIRNNRFVGCGESQGYNGIVVQVIALKDNGYAVGRPVVGIVIEGNTFVDQTGPAISLAATQGAIIRNNRVEAKADVPRNPGAIIEIHDSASLMIDHNVIDDQRRQTAALVDVAAEIPAGTAGLTMTNNEARLAPQSVLVLDRRGK